MEGFTESVALDWEVSFPWVIQVVIHVAVTLLSVDTSFTSQSLKTGS